jgi:hypothetical protein
MMMGLNFMGRPVFVLRVQAQPGVHVIRSLRAWLKEGLRTFGLRCVSIEELIQENKAMVDVRKYTSGTIMPDHLHDGPRQERIIHSYISEKHDVPVLEFESGDQLFAWPNIARALVRAYGYESEDWKGHLVELSLGSYVDKKTGETKETIILKTITSRDGGGNNGSPQRADPAKLPAPVKRDRKSDLDDDIPF